MPKKLSSAVAGTLAVGLTLPATAAAAQAAADSNSEPPQGPVTGSGAAGPASTLASGVSISTQRAGNVAAPLAAESYTFSTEPGPRCISVQGTSTYHLGQDLIAEEGTPIAAIADGTVVRTLDGTPGRSGYVVLRHNIGGEVYHSGYVHLWDAESHVSLGDTVSAGDIIAEVGDSGPTVTPHLHLELWRGAWQTGTALNPAEWLAERGVDLRGAADGVLQREVPQTCDYYTAAPTQLRASAAASADVLAQLPRGAELTAAPGDASDGFLRVQHEGRTGWVQQSLLAPDEPAEQTSTAEPAAAASGTFRVTEPLNARSGPGTEHEIVQGMPTGEEITVTARSGDWVQFTRRGEQVWSHSAYLAPADSGQSTEAASAASSSSAQTLRVTEPLNLRSGPGTENAVVGGMPTGEQVTVLSTRGDWAEIRRANGQEGWSHRAYLSGGGSADSSDTAAESDAPTSAEADSSSAGSSSAASASGSSQASGAEGASGEAEGASDSAATDAPASSSGGEPTHTVDGVYLNARSGAGVDHPVVTVLAPETGVQVTGSEGGWSQIQHQGRTLWVYTDYLSGGEQAQDSGDSEGSSSPNASSEGSTSEGGSSAEQAESPEASSGETEEPTESESAEEPPAAQSAAPAPEPEDSQQTDSDETARTTMWQNMRSGAGLDHPVTRAVPAGESLEILDESHGWFEVRAGGSTGWMWGEFLDLPDSVASAAASDAGGSSSDSTGSEPTPEPNEDAEDASDQPDANDSSETESSSSGSSRSSSGSGSGSDESPSTGWRAQTTTAVNMRSGAGLDYGVEQIVAGGQTLRVLDEQGGWYQVRSDVSTGWIWQEFLEVSGAPSSSGSSSSGSQDSSSGSSSSSSSSSSSGSSSSNSGSSSSGGSSSGSSSGRSGPSSGQHAQSQHGPYSRAWDRLVQCESGGNWSINTGNGYFGGLQFSQQSWEWVGGSGRPDQASKQEQIERAYQLWQRQGWGAWPSCSSQLGLSGDPGGWGDSYFEVHGGTQSASAQTSAGQWTAVYSVPLREQPDSQSDRLAQIPRGAVLQTGQRSGSWIEVEYQQEGETLTGWVNTRYVTTA